MKTSACFRSPLVCIFISAFFLLCSFEGQAQKEVKPQVTNQDLLRAIGNWTGSITYLDYQSGEPFSMPCEVVVEQKGKIDQLTMRISYPSEPKANSNDKLLLRRNGTMLNKGSLITRNELENGDLELVTTQTGMDDNRSATIRYTYLIGAKELRIRKDVQFTNQEKWIKRSEYAFTRS